MKRNFVLTIVVILCLVLAAALSLALFSLFSGGNGSSGSGAPTSSVTTTSLSSSETSTSSEPPVPVWDPATDPDYKLMDGTVYNFNFRFYMHTDFVARPVSNPGYKLIAMGKDDDGGKLPELMITYGPAEPDLLTYTAKAFEERMHDSGATDYTCLAVEPFTIGGIEGIKILGQTLRADEKVSHDKYMVNHNGEVYILHYTSSAENIGDDRGDKIAMSFEFLD